MVTRITMMQNITGGLEAGGGTLLPAGITSAQLLNDYSIPVTTPAAMSVPVPMNGRVLRLNTTALATSYDPTKLTATVVRQGFTSAAAPTTYSDTVNFSQRIRRPATNETQFSLDVNGSDYIGSGALDLATDRTIYGPDTVTLNFSAGFVTGSSAGTVTSLLTRSDNRPYRMPVGRPVSEPYGVYRGATNVFEVAAGCDSPRSFSLLAAVRAFLIDKNGTKGNVSTTGTMTVSVDASGAFSGLKGWCYSLNLDTTGLADGVGAQVVYQLVPWVGDTIWDSRTFGEAWPTISYPKSLPCTIDNVGDYQPLYALVSQAKTGLAGTSTAGLCATEAGAIAGNAPYTSEREAAKAMKLANNTGTGGTGAVTILSDNGLSTKSFTRVTAHNDCDALVISLAVVAGSAAQFGVSTTGSYTWTVPADQSVCPVNNVPVTIKSPTGAYDDGVRYTGGTGLTLGNKLGFRLMILQGITLDSAFTSTGTDMICIYGSTAGNPASLPTAAAAIVTMTRDCRVRKLSGSSGALHQMGYTKHTRMAMTGEASNSGLGVTPGAFAGNFGWTNCLLNACGSGIIPTLLLGTRLINTAVASQGIGVQPNINGIVMGNFEVHVNAVTSSPLQLGAGRPVRDVLLYSYLVRQTTAGVSPNVSISADGAITTTLNLIDIGRTSAGQRTNVNYSDQGYTGIGTDAVMQNSADEQYNTKHDAFTAPENPCQSTPRPALPYVSGSYYNKGAILTDMTAITAISGSGTVVTATVGTGHGVNIGDQVIVDGVGTTTAYNCTFSAGIATNPFSVTAVTATTIMWLASTTGTGSISASTIITANSKGIYQAIRDIPAPATLDSVTVTAAGAGYTYATVALTGGGATRQATVNAVLQAGVLTGFIVVDRGAGYTSNPTLTVTGDGTGATGSAIYNPAAIAITNAAYFSNAATLYGTNQWNVPYGEKSLRTDNWNCRFHIDHANKVCRHSFNDSTTVNGTFGELGPTGVYFGRGGTLLAGTANVGWYKVNTASSGTEAAFKDPSGTNVVVLNPASVSQNFNPLNDFGDYRPKSIAGGDATNSPLLSRIPTGFAPYPQDAYGTAYRNDGTDAAGFRNN